MRLRWRQTLNIPMAMRRCDWWITCWMKVWSIASMRP
jgi:hypothetical protein